MCLEFHMPRKVDGCHIHIPKHGALSAVDTRVTNFPAGGVFESAWGAPEEYRARYRYGAGLFWFNAMSKAKRPLAGGASGRL